MAVADLSLALNVQSSGTAEIDKLISALNKYSDKIDQIRNQKPPEAAPWEKFGQDVKNAIENPLQAAGNAAKGLLDKLGPVGTGMALFGGAVIAAGAAAVTIAHQMGELGLSIQNTALRMGLSTKEVGQFTLAAKVAGSDIGSLEGSMRKLSLGLVDSSADGEKARRGLAALGVSARDANGEIRPMNDIFIGHLQGALCDGQCSRAQRCRREGFSGALASSLSLCWWGCRRTSPRRKRWAWGWTKRRSRGSMKSDKLLSGVEAKWAELARKPKIALTLEIGALWKWIKGDDHTGSTAVKEWFFGEDRDLNDSRSPYARARDAFRTKDNTTGPVTPQERETERYWKEQFSSPEWQVKELTGQLALY